MLPHLLLLEVDNVMFFQISDSIKSQIEQHRVRRSMQGTG